MSEAGFLTQERSLPDGSGRGNVVQWHVFRDREQAEAFIPAIQLAAGQQLVGGYSRDSIGPFWWVGVQVEQIERWGHPGAINKHAQ